MRGRIPGPPRRPQNPSEGAFYDSVSKRGLYPTKRGWPDFAVFDGKELVMLVEVKPHRGRRLKREQAAIMEQLSKYGVPCFRWSPDSGLEPVGSLPPEEDVV